jgi:hypothetical protein
MLLSCGRAAAVAYPIAGLRCIPVPRLPARPRHRPRADTAVQPLLEKNKDLFLATSPVRLFLSLYMQDAENSERPFVVTGGTGFLGVALVQLLISKGHRQEFLASYSPLHRNLIVLFILHSGFT